MINEVHKLELNIEQKLVNEFIKMENKLVNIMNEYGNSNLIEPKRKRVQINKENLTPNIINLTENENKTSKIKKVDKNNGMEIKLNSTHKLLPPNSENHDIKNVYEIHVSKFHPNTNVDDIIEHIISNTTVKNPDLFKVEKLMKKTAFKNEIKFISFKISTLKQGIYEKIMDENVWSPDFIARDFENTWIKRNDNYTQYKQTKYNRHKQINETPKLSSKKNMRRNILNSKQNEFTPKSNYKYERKTPGRSMNQMEGVYSMPFYGNKMNWQWNGIQYPYGLYQYGLPVYDHKRQGVMVANLNGQYNQNFLPQNQTTQINGTEQN